MPSAVFLLSLYVIEFFAVAGVMAVYKKGERLLLPFLASPAGFVLIAAVLLLTISVSVILFQLHKSPSSWKRYVTTHLVLNLCSVLSAVAIIEVVIRFFEVHSIEGPVFANTLMLPRSWKSVAAYNRQFLAKASAQGSYLIYDKDLGWTVGRSRRSEDYNRESIQKLHPELRTRYSQNYPHDIYLSSKEGIRSPRAGMEFASVPTQHHIAIVGDSFTFGLEVPYEQTWGHQLEIGLGSKWQVLNFGVDGYGVDQAYLRYKRDVQQWHPKIVIFGIIDDDFRRTVGVYGFLTFSGGLPFPKPRFVVRGDKLVQLNSPLPDPEFIFTRKVITDLPFVEYDGSFQSAEWEWRYYFHAHSIRFLLSRFPRWRVAEPNTDDEAIKSINGAILRSFLGLAHAQGSMPMIVYFPSRSDFVGPHLGGKRVAREVFQSYGIPFLDMTNCVSQVNPMERFMVLHYSAMTNAAVAKCLRDAISTAMRG